MSKKNRGRQAPQIDIKQAMELAAEKAAALATERSVAQVTRVVEATLPIIERAKEQQGGHTSGSQLRRAMNQRTAKTVYGLNDPQRFTVSQDPRYRPFSGVTVEHLRLLARRYDVLAACITHLKSEVVKTPIKVVPLDDKDKSDATKKQIADATKFLGVTGGIGGWGAPREEYEAKLLDDVLVIGAGASWLSYDTVGAMSKGSPDEVIAVDAGTIRPLVTPFGFPPDDDQPRYEQWVQGFVTASFKREEMIYRGLPIFAQTNSPYYISPVELLISVVFTALKADEWNRTWLTDGNTPDWWMQMPDGMSPDQAVEWLDLFDAMMSGELGMRHKIRLTPGEPKPGNSRKDSDFDIYEHWLMERTCSVMGVNPASIGHHSDTYKDSQEIALKSTSGGRVAQLLMFRNGHYTEILERKGYDKVKVVDAVVGESAMARAERQKIEFESGIKTLNEIRQENGDEPYDHPLADMPFIRNDLVPLSSVLVQPTAGSKSEKTGPFSRGLRLP
jgi:hypothetical protein